MSGTGRGGAGEVDRSAPPPPGPERPYRFPRFSRHRLPGGLELLLAPLRRAPLVNLDLLPPGGAQHDPPGAEGLATLTAKLLEKGTDRRSATDIAAHLERLGGTLTTGANWDTAYAAVQVQARDLETGLGLLAEVATRPTFPPEEVERARRERLADLVQRRDQPAAVADDRLAYAIYGQGTYGRPSLGTEGSVAGLDREAIRGFYRRHYRLDGSTLIAVGDFDPERLVEAAAAAFAAAAGGDPPPPPELAAPELDGLRVEVVDRPGAPQCALRLGHAGVARRHPDYLPLKVATTLLGGKFSSRLNLNLRERKGYTYGIWSVLAARLGPGPLYVTTNVASPVVGAAVGEILTELERLAAEPPSAAELRDTQTYLNGAFPYSLQTMSGLASRLEDLALYSLPDDHYDRLPAEVAAVSREEVLRVAREHVRPQRMAIVAVGAADALTPQLEPFGPVRVVSADLQ